MRIAERIAAFFAVGVVLSLTVLVVCALWVVVASVATVQGRVGYLPPCASEVDRGPCLIIGGDGLVKGIVSADVLYLPTENPLP